MKFLELWKGITDSLSTQGGSLLLLTFILLVFFPLLLTNDQEGWKAVMFILGAIAGVINTSTRKPQEPPPPPPTPPTPPTDTEAK